MIEIESRDGGSRYRERERDRDRGKEGWQGIYTVCIGSEGERGIERQTEVEGSRNGGSSG